ncbi:MAG: hypothetical protein H3C43_05765 [Leptonema sp. (in: Bacteria)]|nr:hypothetical protein [Leptonema sp. (in: bacteria)]
MAELRYLMSKQIVPSKGMSYTLYEIEGIDTILRMLTTLPDVGEISIFSNPPVKKLFAPDRCEITTADEFHKLWQEGLEKKAQ